MNDITEPDFEEWADSCVSNGEGSHTSIALYVEQALKQAYDQGKALGYLRGYDHGINIGWAELQDADHKWVGSYNDEKDTDSEED